MRSPFPFLHWGSLPPPCAYYGTKIYRLRSTRTVRQFKVWNCGENCTFSACPWGRNTDCFHCFRRERAGMANYCTINIVCSSETDTCWSSKAVSASRSKRMCIVRPFCHAKVNQIYLPHDTKSLILFLLLQECYKLRFVQALSTEYWVFKRWVN